MKTKSCSTYRTILVTVVLSVVFCIGLSICVVVLFTLVGNLQHNLQQLQNSKEVGQKLCQPCSELKTGPFDDDNPMIGKLDRDGDNCCATTARQTQIMMTLMFQRQKTVSDNLGSGNFSQSKDSGDDTSTSGVVSAHLLVGLQDLNRKRNAQAPIRNWYKDDPVSHLEGINLHNDKLLISQDGLYLVYSQISFSISDRNYPVGAKVPFLYHYVYRFNPIYPNGGNQLLMKSVNSQRIEPTVGFGDLTSYTSAALRLKKGDQLYVKVSNSSLVSRDQKASFFGLVKISPR